MDVLSLCVTSPFLAVFAGVFIYIGLQHLFVGLVSDQRILNVSFGLYALFIGSFQVGLIYTLRATTVENYILANKILFISFKIAGLARLIYMTEYTKIVYRKFIFLYVLLTVVLVSLILFSPTGYCWSEITGIGFYKSYFNETTAYIIGNMSIINMGFDLIITMLLSAHTFIVLIKHYLKTYSSFTLFLFLIFGSLFISQTYSYWKNINNFNTVFFQIGYLIFMLVIASVLLSKHFKFAGLEAELKLQDKLSQEKEDITHMIVHDLKTPLNALLNLQKNLPKDEILNLVSGFTRKMQFQVMDILDIYNTDNFSLKLNREEWDLNDIIESSIENVKFFIKQKDIQLLYNIQLRCVVIADDRILERIITNLLSNSIKYSQNGGFIEVAVSKVNMDFVEIKVIDNGIGIEKTKLANVFNKFETINKQNNEIIQSTGMGLAFCKMAVEAHGGKILLDSIVGKGTTVSFYVSLIHDYPVYPKESNLTDSNLTTS